ncbi:hypothetical protein COCMIDRAFT_21908 [Bipolaris oryzae ATCC 44560]|uniref:Uncharacterized protein n=1 Tax=Bipolaris oryzae ATCC 44560 TaxID=930090 RepID=W6ZKR1_COCMI|nr:uncharacterized protein COCMIDRAFT_21908 [Bipolaris oryzae ATCC 44560]EUC50593.1 hypothetical protein COCMIDRAFT_21908 [Bipolaris oryzae ATCC 44560]
MVTDKVEGSVTAKYTPAMPEGRVPHQVACIEERVTLEERKNLQERKNHEERINLEDPNIHEDPSILEESKVHEEKNKTELRTAPHKELSDDDDVNWKESYEGLWDVMSWTVWITIIVIAIRV